ncbi:MAG: hypothetical protein D6737_16975 [Chloroflexi bacterium]|nr:MAG: hypothetical protein D6737_16975 [Chloroflexota bacterium]
MVKLLKSYHKLLLVMLLALGVRLVVLPLIHHPGIGDPNHYYNLGNLLAEGRGFNIDYIWQFNDPPEQINHPDDYWMPLTNVFVAGSVTLFGSGVRSAILPFIVMSLFIPVIAYLAARQLNTTEDTALFAAATTAVLPEFVLNSLRTDTTIPNVLLVCGSILLLTVGVRRGRFLPYVLSGVLAGLAFLVRSDSSLLVPMLIVTMIAYHRWGRDLVTDVRSWRFAVATVVVMAAVVAPWIARNYSINGTPTTPKVSQMFFLTDFREHYVYDDDITLATLLEKQTIPQLIGKRLFEMAASAKLMYTTLDIFLPIPVLGGLLLLIYRRDRDRLLILAPALILLLGVYLFYTILVPFKSQGGSFKKAYLTLIPLIVPLASYALEHAIQDRRLRIGAMLLVVAFMTANAVELVRQDSRNVTAYMDFIHQMVDEAQQLPDTNGDGEIVLMTQDPFMFRFYGMRTVMIPMDDREAVLEVAQRYGADYIMMPPDRPALDPIAQGTEIDPRFEHVRDVPGTGASFFGFNFDGS